MSGSSGEGMESRVEVEEGVVHPPSVTFGWIVFVDLGDDGVEGDRCGDDVQGHSDHRTGVVLDLGLHPARRCEHACKGVRYWTSDTDAPDQCLACDGA